MVYVVLSLQRLTCDSQRGGSICAAAEDAERLFYWPQSHRDESLVLQVAGLV